MPSFAESLPLRDRKRYICYAYISTWFGCFADVMLDSSAIMIIYFAMLNTSNSLIMFSAALTGIIQLLMLIPSSLLTDRFGPKKMTCVSSIMSCSGYLLVATAPCWGTSAQYVILTGITIFCFSRPIWTTSWYPVLGDILLPEERGGFLGKMRFSYHIITGVVFYIFGQLMGKNPPMWYLQAATAVTGLLALGRFVFINKIKLSDTQCGNRDLKKAFSISIHNAPLVGFSTYCCFFSLAYTAVIPLALLYLKNGLDMNADTVQTLSTLGIAGSIAGYLLYGKIVKITGMRYLQILIHALWFFIPLGFIFCTENTPYLAAVAGALLFVAYLAHAWFFCSFSQECLSLSRPGNAAMASALANTCNSGGTAVGRTAGSLLLGQGMLAASWNWNGFPMSDFQTVFLFCSAGVAICAVLLLSLPSIISNHDNYYQP